MLHQVSLSSSVIPEMIQTWQSIFPAEKLFTGFDGYNCFEYSLIPGNIGNHRYYLYYDNNQPVGMSGFYDEPNENPRESAWLGWFGVIEKYRMNGFGRQIISCFESEALKFGYKYCRVYTEDAEDNSAIQFYSKCGYTFEKYTGRVPLDVHCDKITIGSKAISDKPLIPWNNREIFFE